MTPQEALNTIIAILDPDSNREEITALGSAVMAYESMQAIDPENMDSMRFHREQTRAIRRIEQLTEDLWKERRLREKEVKTAWDRIRDLEYEIVKLKVEL